MSQFRELNTHVTTVDEVITYIDEPNQRIGHLDMGAADLLIMRTPDGQVNIVITTASGHAARFPAAFFATLR